MHIELRRWADVFVIAPLSANTLAKIASVCHHLPPGPLHLAVQKEPTLPGVWMQGMCDNLLTCVVRAWDYGKPLLVAPAMNTFMWENPFTNRHLQELQQTLAVQVIPPVSDTWQLPSDPEQALPGCNGAVSSWLLCRSSKSLHVETWATVQWRLCRKSQVQCGST